MNLREYQRLLAERATVKQMLADIPEELIIDRMSMQSRLELLDEQIDSVPAPNREPARAQLTFRGNPVIGTHGVFAAFGAEAVGAFSTAVATLGASLQGVLGERGRLPGNASYALLITGTAHGSFGFELEEAPLADQGTLFSETRDVELALDKTWAILDALSRTDEELTEALIDADERAVKRLHDFLKVLEKHRAMCALNLAGRSTHFSDVEQVKNCADRLSSKNIKEETVSWSGRLEGVLPDARNFEFSVDEDGRVIRGKVAPEVDIEVLKTQVDKLKNVKLRQRQVGQGRPTFTLVAFLPELP